MFGECVIGGEKERERRESSAATATITAVAWTAERWYCVVMKTRFNSKQ